MQKTIARWSRARRVSRSSPRSRWRWPLHCGTLHNTAVEHNRRGLSTIYNKATYALLPVRYLNHRTSHHEASYHLSCVSARACTRSLVLRPLALQREAGPDRTATMEHVSLCSPKVDRLFSLSDREARQSRTIPRRSIPQRPHLGAFSLLTTATTCQHRQHTRHPARRAVRLAVCLTKSHRRSPP